MDMNAPKMKVVVVKKVQEEAVTKANVDQKAKDVMVSKVKSGKKTKNNDAQGKKTTDNKTSNNKGSDNKASNKKGNSKNKASNSKINKGKDSNKKTKGKSGTNEDSDFPTEEEDEPTGGLLPPMNVFFSQTEHTSVLSALIDSVHEYCTTMFFGDDDGKFFGGKKTNDGKIGDRTPNGNTPTPNDERQYSHSQMNRDDHKTCKNKFRSRPSSGSNPGISSGSSPIISSSNPGTPSTKPGILEVKASVISAGTSVKDKGKTSLKQASPKQTQQSKRDATSTQLVNEKSKASSKETLIDKLALKTETLALKAETDVAKTETNGGINSNAGKNAKNSKRTSSSTSLAKSVPEKKVPTAKMGMTRSGGNAKVDTTKQVAATRFENCEKTHGKAVPVLAKQLAEEDEEKAKQLGEGQAKQLGENQPNNFNSSPPTGETPVRETAGVAPLLPSVAPLIVSQFRKSKRVCRKISKAVNDALQEGYEWTKNSSVVHMGKNSIAHQVNIQGNSHYDNSYQGNNQANWRANVQSNAECNGKDRNSYDKGYSANRFSSNKGNSGYNSGNNSGDCRNGNNGNNSGNCGNGNNVCHLPMVNSDCIASPRISNHDVVTVCSQDVSLGARGSSTELDASFHSIIQSESEDPHVSNIQDPDLKSELPSNTSDTQSDIQTNVQSPASGASKDIHLKSEFSNTSNIIGNIQSVVSESPPNASNVQCTEHVNPSIVSVNNAHSNTNGVPETINAIPDINSVSRFSDIPDINNVPNLNDIINDLGGLDGVDDNKGVNALFQKGNGNSVPNIKSLNSNAPNINTPPNVSDITLLDGLNAMPNNGLNNSVNNNIKGDSDNIPFSPLPLSNLPSETPSMSSGVNGGKSNGIKGGDDINNLLNVNVLNALAQIVNGTRNVANGIGNGASGNLSPIDLAAMLIGTVGTLNGNEMMSASVTNGMGATVNGNVVNDIGGNVTNGSVPNESPPSIDVGAMIKGYGKIEGSGSRNANSSKNGQVHVNSANNGQVNANSSKKGQVHVNSANNGQVNANSANTGQVNANSANNGQVNVNSANNGQVHENSANSGQVHVNSANNGQVNANSANNEQVNANSANKGQGNANSANNEQMNANSANNGQGNANSANNEQVNANSANNEDQNWIPVKSAKAKKKSKAQKKSMSAHAVEGKVNLTQAVEGKPPNSTYTNPPNSTHSMDSKVNATGKTDGEVISPTKNADAQVQKEAESQVQGDVQGDNKQGQPKSRVENNKQAGNNHATSEAVEISPLGKDEQVDTRPLGIANGEKKLQSKNISKQAELAEPESQAVPQKPDENADVQSAKAESRTTPKKADAQFAEAEYEKSVDKAGDKPADKSVDKPTDKHAVEIVNAGIAKPVEVAKPSSKPPVLDDKHTAEDSVGVAEPVEDPAVLDDNPAERPTVLDDENAVLDAKPGHQPGFQVQDHKLAEKSGDKPGVLNGKPMDTEGFFPMEKGKKKCKKNVPREEPVLVRNGFDLLQTNASLLQTHVSQVNECQIDGSLGTLTKGNDGEALNKGNERECNEERSRCEAAGWEGGIHNECEDDRNKCERNEWEGGMLTGCKNKWEEGGKNCECKESWKACELNQWEGSTHMCSAEGSKQTCSAQGSKQTCSTQGSKQTCSAEGSKQTCSAEGSTPICSAEGSTPICSAEGSKQTCSAERSTPICSAEGSRQTCSAQGSKQTCSTQGSKPTCSAQGSRQTCSAQGSKQTCSTQGSKQTCSTQGSKQTCSAEGSQQTCSAEGSTPICSAEGSKQTCSAQGSKQTCSPEGRRQTLNGSEQSPTLSSNSMCPEDMQKDVSSKESPTITEKQGVTKKNGFREVIEKNGSLTRGEETLSISMIVGKGVGKEPKSVGQATTMASDIKASEFIPSVELNQDPNGESNGNAYESNWIYKDGNWIYSNQYDQGESQYNEGDWIYNEGENQYSDQHSENEGGDWIYNRENEEGDWTYNSENEGGDWIYNSENEGGDWIYNKDQGEWLYNGQEDWSNNNQHSEHYSEECPVDLNNSTTLHEHIMELLKRPEEVVGKQTDHHMTEDDPESRNLPCSDHGSESSKLDHNKTANKNHIVLDESTLHIPGLDEAVASARLGGSQNEGMRRYFASLKLRDSKAI